MAMTIQEDVRELRQKLEQFVKAWATGEVDLLDDCVVKEPFTYFSTHGNCYTLDQLKQQLLHTGKAKTVSEMTLENEMSRVSGDQAVQYGTMTGFFADGTRHLAFGGSFTNKLVKQEGVWMLSEIRFELQTDDSVRSYTLDEGGHVNVEPGSGDLEFIENWRKVNTAIGCFVDEDPSQGIHTILGEQDAPWYCVPEEIELGDEESIRQLLLKYFYAFDFNTPDLLEEVFAQDCTFLSNQAGSLNGEEAKKYLTIVRQASSRAFHAVHFEEIRIKDEQARVRAVRLCPETAKVIGEANGSISVDMDAGTYDLTLEKQDGSWKIQRFAYSPNQKEELQ